MTYADLPRLTRGIGLSMERVSLPRRRKGQSPGWGIAGGVVLVLVGVLLMMGSF